MKTIILNDGTVITDVVRLDFYEDMVSIQSDTDGVLEYKANQLYIVR